MAQGTQEKQCSRGAKGKAGHPDTLSSQAHGVAQLGVGGGAPGHALQQGTCSAVEGCQEHSAVGEAYEVSGSKGPIASTRGVRGVCIP